MELNVFRTAVPPCMGAKIEAAMNSKLIVEPPPQPEVDEDILQEMNGQAAAAAATAVEPPQADSEC